MPVKKYNKGNVRHTTQVVDHSLDLLNSRALIALSNYLYYDIDDHAHYSMEILFKNYKPHKQEVHQALVRAFQFLVIDRFIPHPDDPPYYTLPEGPPPSKAVITMAKKHINQIAKKIWKK